MGHDGPVSTLIKDRLEAKTSYPVFPAAPAEGRAALLCANLGLIWGGSQWPGGGRQVVGGACGH